MKQRCLCMAERYISKIKRTKNITPQNTQKGYAKGLKAKKVFLCVICVVRGKNVFSLYLFNKLYDEIKK